VDVITLGWPGSMTTEEAKKYHETSGFIAVETYREAMKKQSNTEKKVDLLTEDKTLDLTKSKELVKRALNVFPGGANTLSKYPDRYPLYPVIKSGNGCKVFDSDNNIYIDWTAGLGAIITGYNMFQGCDCDSSLPSLFSSVTEVEIELAEKLIDIIPCADKVRFFKTGSESTLAAIRLARHITGRSQVLYCGYHSWHDWYANDLPADKKSGTLYGSANSFIYGNYPENGNTILDSSIAAVIMEPVNRYHPERASEEYLSQIKNWCDENGTVLIFDEILSGFRLGFGPSDFSRSIVPDLACYSKAMSNGAPISALVGKKEYMNQLKDLHVSGTFNGEGYSCYAALKNIKFMEEHLVIESIWEKADDMLSELYLMVCNLPYVTMKHFGPWFCFHWNDSKKREKFYSYTLSNGIYSNDMHFIMYAHNEKDISQTLEVYKKAFARSRG